MATSGSTILQLSRNDIINAAYRKLLVLDIDSVASAAQLTNGAMALNTLIAEFQTLGMPLWARKEYAIPMIAGQKDYILGFGQVLNTPLPLHVYQAVRTQTSNVANVEVSLLSRQEFNLLPVNSSAIPVNCTYQPLINSGVFSVWPTPDANIPAGLVITITYQAPFEYFVTGTDTPDFPQEWANALIYGTAGLLAPENGTPIMDREKLDKDAGIHLSNVLANGVEDGSISSK
jgi:hypothetical protein